MLDAKNISSHIAPHPLYIQNVRLRRTFYMEWYKCSILTNYSGCQDEQSTRAPNKPLVYNRTQQ